MIMTQDEEGAYIFKDNKYWDSYNEAECYEQDNGEQTMDCLLFRNLHVAGWFYFDFAIFVAIFTVFWFIALLGTKIECCKVHFKHNFKFIAKFI